jgi:hypothetical protein
MLTSADGKQEADRGQKLLQNKSTVTLFQHTLGSSSKNSLSKCVDTWQIHNSQKRQLSANVNWILHL